VSLCLHDSKLNYRSDFLLGNLTHFFNKVRRPANPATISRWACQEPRVQGIVQDSSTPNNIRAESYQAPPRPWYALRQANRTDDITIQPESRVEG